MLRKILLAVLVLWSTAGLFAQSGALKGKIIDVETKEPIPFANIVIEMNGQMLSGGSSDFDGKYTIKPLQAGKYTVKASYVGYKTLQLEGVIVNADKIRFLDLKLESSTKSIEEVVIVGYTVPLIDKDNTQTGGTVTSDEIAKMAGRSAEGVASTVGGVYQEDGEVKSIRGAREEATVYYIDGMKVRGTNSLPKSSIEQVTVVTGGLAAKYGDATGGIISITTKGPSRTFFGGFEFMTSHFLDAYSDNIFGFSLSGPVISKKVVDPYDETKMIKKPIAGFFLSAELNYTKDANPSGIGVYRVKDDVKEQIIKDPIVASPDGTVTILNAEYLTMDSFEKHKYKENVANYGTNLSAKIDIAASKNFNITIGGTYDFYNSRQYAFVSANNSLGVNPVSAGEKYSYANQIFNADNNPLYTSNTWRTYIKFTQKFTEAANEDESSASVIKNAYYTIQADYTKDYRSRRDAEHDDDFFNYGYIGKFETDKVNSFAHGEDTVSGFTGYIHNSFRDVSYMLDTLFPYGKPNADLARYTERYYSLFDDPNMYTNSVQVQNGGGLLNGETSDLIYDMLFSPGERFDQYYIINNSQFRVTAAGAADIKDHEISLGFEFEQRSDRYFSMGDGNNGPIELWSLARNLTNFHISQLDTRNPYLVFDNGNFRWDSLPNEGTFNDTVYYERLYNSGDQALFDQKLREKLGMPLDGKDWIDVDALDPSIMTLDFFSADELFNSGASFVKYYGYDHTGKKTTENPTFEDFFTDYYVDQVGNVQYYRNIAPFQPTYMSGYIQDKFSFNDLVFNIGVRIDRYDANQKTPKDEYLFFDTYRVGDTDLQGVIANTDMPSNIKDGYAIYVNNYKDPTKIVGYRNGRTWYDPEGIEILDPAEIYQSGVINPYLTNPSDIVGGQSFLSAFGDYEAQVSVMPRISFSFPISDVALFFAHYDVLTKRPAGYGRIEPIDYLYIYTQSGDLLNNPNLLPEQTIDYELGFQQKISNTSSLKFSAFYREMRDMAQIINNEGAYPVSYKTYGNIDFGTVKGLSVAYDLRRTGNVSLRVNYTLQFANGTGSDANTAWTLVSTNQPNLRVLLPYDFDQRHAFSVTVDYRFASGKAYNGPKWFGTDIFANTGANFIINSGSGTPFSKKDLETGYLEGSLNGSTKPWRTSINMKVDKDIELKWGKGEDDNKKTALLNIYFDIANLLDTENIMEVYETTGNADDDGYRTDPRNQNFIESQISPDSYLSYYSMVVNNPIRYSLPRRIRLGIMLSF